MTEDEAQEWIISRFGVRCHATLLQFVGLTIEETARQNLVAPSTVPAIWSRHVVDSAQLVPLSGNAPPGVWIDVGSGAGFPGMVAAVLSGRRTLLIEPRRKRATFLERAADTLGLSGQVVVQASRIQDVRETAAIISARAVAQPQTVIAQARHCSMPETVWLLPVGRTIVDEAKTDTAIPGVFHVERSLTDPASHILVVTGVAA